MILLQTMATLILLQAMATLLCLLSMGPLQVWVNQITSCQLNRTAICTLLLFNNCSTIGNVQVRHPIEWLCYTNKHFRKIWNFDPKLETWKLNLPHNTLLTQTTTHMILQSILAIADVIYSHFHCQSTTSFIDSVDSTTASCALMPKHNSSGWPLQYPPAILWTFEDCKRIWALTSQQPTKHMFLFTRLSSIPMIWWSPTQWSRLSQAEHAWLSTRFCR